MAIQGPDYLSTNTYNNCSRYLNDSYYSLNQLDELKIINIVKKKLYLTNDLLIINLYNK